MGAGRIEIGLKSSRALRRHDGKLLERVVQVGLKSVVSSLDRNSNSNHALNSASGLNMEFAWRISGCKPQQNHPRAGRL